MLTDTYKRQISLINVFIIFKQRVKIVFLNAFVFFKRILYMQVSNASEMQTVNVVFSRQSNFFKKKKKIKNNDKIKSSLSTYRLSKSHRRPCQMFTLLLQLETCI